jgi:predicted transcriptional regulator
MARLFYSQRNVYITGAILFLTVAIPTVFTIVRRLIKYEELKQQSLDPKLVSDKIKELQAQLEAKARDLETLQKQKRGLEHSYDELADKLNVDSPKSDKKND